VLDRTAHRVTVAGAEVELTATELKLLRTLLEREGRVQTRAQLLEATPRISPCNKRSHRDTAVAHPAHNGDRAGTRPAH